MAALTIYYAGVDITDYVRQETIRIESSGSALAAICRLVAEDRLGQAPWFNPADKAELVIYDGVTRIFGGWANIIDAQHDGPFRGFPIRASDYTVQLEEHVVVDTYTAAGTSDQALIHEMFADWCAPIDATVHTQVIRAAMPEMHFHSILIRQAMDNICRKSGGMYYVDFDRRLHYFEADEGVSAPDILSTEPNEVTSWPYHLKRRRFDASKLCNNVLIIGNGIEVWREHAASIAHYAFRYQDTLQDSNVDTVEEAEYLGDWYLSRHAWPNETLEVTCWRPWLRAGQNIRLINSVLGIDQFYSIRKAVITCTGSYEPHSPQFVVRLTLGLQDAPGRPDFEPPPHRPIPPPVPPPPEPPDGGWRQEVWVATRDFGPFHTPDFVTDTRYAHGVPTWTADNTGLTLIGEDCRGFRGDPFNCGARQYCLMTDGLYRKEGAGNWTAMLTWAAAQAAAGGNHANSHFGQNGMDTSINQQGHVAVLFNAVHSVSGGRAVLFTSLDYGATWSMDNIDGWNAWLPQAHSLTIGALRGSSPYAAGQAMYAIGQRSSWTYLWYSTDGGASWNRTVIGTANYTAHCLADPSDQGRVFVGGLNGAGPYNVGVSIDHGATVAQYDAAASEDLGYPGENATYYHLSVGMDILKAVRTGADAGRQHIHTTRDDGGSWEEITPEYSADQLGISIVQDAVDLLYLVRQSSGGAVTHVIYASENNSRDMIPKGGANQHIADTGGGDSIPYNCGGVRGILQIWTDRAEGDVPGVPVDHDLGRHPGGITWPQAAGIVGTGPGTVAAGSHASQHEEGGADPIAYEFAYEYMQIDVAAAQASVPLDVLGLAGNTEIVMPYSGSALAISIASNTPRTAGTLTVDVTVNGAATGLQAVLDGVNTQYDYMVQARDLDVFAAGDRLGGEITTTAGWLPVTADIVVNVIVEM